MSPSEHEKGAGQEPQHGLPLTASPHGNNSFGSLSVVVVFPSFWVYHVAKCSLLIPIKFITLGTFFFSGCEVRECVILQFHFPSTPVQVQEFKLSEL